MRLIKRIFILGGLLFLAGIAGAGYLFFLRPQTLPVYYSEQRRSQQADFMASLISLGERTYISDTSEFSLEMTVNGVGKNRRVGRTSDGLDVYTVPEQDPQNYLMATTEMFPAVIFRNIQLPPMRPGSTHFDQLQLLYNFGGGPQRVTARDAALVVEVVGTLTRRAGILARREGARGAGVSLSADSLPGLAYHVYVYATADGSVFLSEHLSPDEWIPAGALFTQWFAEAVGS